MDCTVITAESVSRDIVVLKRLFYDLTRPGSDFNRKLFRWMNVGPGGPEDGSIAVVKEDDEIVGWARTEPWLSDNSWDTLEAFVAPAWRGCGVAAFATAGLVASTLPTTDDSGRPALVAVFAPSMLLVARRAGLHPVLFRNDGGKWVKS